MTPSSNPTDPPDSATSAPRQPTTRAQDPSAPPHDAASVVLLRDGPSGLEVFLVQRHGASKVLGGAHVFPGGKVDCLRALRRVAVVFEQAGEGTAVATAFRVAD